MGGGTWVGGGCAAGSVADWVGSSKLANTLS